MSGFDDVNKIYVEYENDDFFFPGKPTEVSCEVFIRSFGSISEKTMVWLQKKVFSFHFLNECRLRITKWISISDSIGLIHGSITQKSNRWLTHF